MAVPLIYITAASAVGQFLVVYAVILLFLAYFGAPTTVVLVDGKQKAAVCFLETVSFYRFYFHRHMHTHHSDEHAAWGHAMSQTETYQLLAHTASYSGPSCSFVAFDLTSFSYTSL